MASPLPNKAPAPFLSRMGYLELRDTSGKNLPLLSHHCHTGEITMQNQVSRMAYLQHASAPLPVIDQGQSPGNTRSTEYGPDDITGIDHWAEFNLASIQQQYGTLLATAQIADEVFPPSPPRPVNSKAAVRSRINTYLVNRVIRALHCGFAHLTSTNQLAGLAILNFDVGTMAAMIDDPVPDYGFFDLSLSVKTRPNCCPGDVKPSFKWSLDMKDHEAPYKRVEFKQVLSQVNYYMNQHRTRYSFILTDKELVAVQRLDNKGNLELSAAIPWDASDTETQPQLTVLLGLWYLGMLAANNQDWFLP